MIDNNDVLDKLEELSTALSMDERKLVLDNMLVHNYEKNELIYDEGDAPLNLLCLIEGKVKIYKDGVGGRSQIVRVVRSVDYFGYRAAFSQENYVTKAAAFEKSTIAIIPMHLIYDLVNKNPHLSMFFIRRLADALGKSDERTVSLTQKHIRGRLAESLLFLKENYGLEEDGCTLCIKPSREDLANLSNMTTSNAIRTLSLFVQEGLVATDGKKIKIVNEDELKKISRIG